MRSQRILVHFLQGVLVKPRYRYMKGSDGTPGRLVICAEGVATIHYGAGARMLFERIPMQVEESGEMRGYYVDKNGWGVTETHLDMLIKDKKLTSLNFTPPRTQVTWYRGRGDPRQ